MVRHICIPRGGLDGIGFLLPAGSRALLLRLLLLLLLLQSRRRRLLLGDAELPPMPPRPCRRSERLATATKVEKTDELSFHLGPCWMLTSITN